MGDEDLQPDERTPDPWERPRDGATITRTWRGRLNLEACPQLLVKYAGMYKLDAAMVCAQGDGILADNIPWTRTTALVEALRARGLAERRTQCGGTSALSPGRPVSSQAKPGLQPAPPRGRLRDARS